MVPSTQPMSNDLLESLQSEDARKIMDTVDRLRKAGLGSIVQLPQIVTVGDQSSGKSSTLEAITGIPFPRKENLCTRFATQIVMRRSRSEEIRVTIMPDKLRPAGEQEKLKALDLKLDDISKLGELMDTATVAMGLDSPDKTQVRAFSRDVLNIEISGPTRPQLTLVDLPGLIHSETKQQTREDVKLITELVEEYIKEKRTIVLAVVSAKNDYANQIVLNKARDLGAADRTLGIVTKTDVLEPGTENEKTWIDLAQNKDVLFGLGWHMLRNRTPKEMDKSLDYRDKTETQFFSSGNYRSLERDMLGIEALRTRLSDLLYEHLTKELPELQQELENKLRETNQNLGHLGQSRSTEMEQRQYIMRVGQDFEKLTQSAIDGHYQHHFFDKRDDSLTVLDGDNQVRLRAAVQFANMQFAAQMRIYGSKYKLTDRPQEVNDLDDEEHKDFKVTPIYQGVEDFQIDQSYANALKWVQGILHHGRGRELPGNFNPAVIGQLFREQSSRWSELATEHVGIIAEQCDEFAKKLLASITSEDVRTRLYSRIVGPELNARTERAMVELKRIIEDKNGDPITYNHYYTTTIQKLRAKKQEKNMKELLNNNSTGITDESGQYRQITDTAGVLQGMRHVTIEQDMDKFSAEDALICHLAYYKDELKFFVNCITKHVVERHMIADLPSGIISAIRFGLMGSDEIRALVAEPSTTVQQRTYLVMQKEMLENGIKQFRTAVGGY
ncbi:hypothetical protein KVT40_002486 [Elsinoe batatas]|uniref:Dynamin family protein n=1 Tax=Elsinoe batatas TaxID=2601811 RepID=A0A8K0PG61_9PEZI|nr:hypothetical protein KVT40_002486 [Elsinoe batatas]